MSVNWSICDCEDVARFSNVSFKELIIQLKKSGIRFSKRELEVPYYSGEWDDEFCKDILNVFADVSDRLIEKDTAWIETLPDIVRAVNSVANSGGNQVLKIG
jgi:hypothetical protein